MTVAIAAGMLGIASASNRLGVAAESGANPFFGQIVNRFESVNDWRTISFMDELLGSQAKFSFLVPAPYKIALAQATDYAWKLDGAITSDALKSIFSPKMRTLLSIHWEDAPSSLPGLWGKSGYVDPNAVDTADNSAADVEDGNDRDDKQAEANSADAFSPYNWLLKGWTTFSFSAVDSFDFYGFFGLGNSNSMIPESENTEINSGVTQYKSAPSDDAESGNGADTPQRNDISRYFFVVFPDSAEDEDANSTFSPPYNGSFGYPFHPYEFWRMGNECKDEGETPWQSRFAALRDGLFESMPSVADEITASGYVEEQYSIKYGNALEEGIDNQTSEKTAAADEETATPPQAIQSATGGYCDFSEDFLKHYLGPEAFFPRVMPIYDLGDNVFGNSGTPIKISPELMLFDDSATLPVLFDSGLFPSTSQAEPPATNGKDAGKTNRQNSNPEDESTSTKSRSHTLLSHVVELFEIETDNWVAAFQHTIAQFSKLHEVF